MLRAFPIGGCLLLCATLSAPAQDAEPTPLRVTPSEGGQAYQDALRWKGVKSEITYFDPEGPAPELTSNARVPRERNNDPLNVTPDGVRVTGILISVAVILAIVMLISRFGNFSVVSLKKEDEVATRRNGKKTVAEETPEEIPALSQIRAMTDKVAALNLLLSGALSIAAEAQGMRLHPSWTVRDAMRRIPKSWTFRPALADLANDAEQAHFGGRPVTEDALHHHLEAMTPVYRGAAA